MVLINYGFCVKIGRVISTQGLLHAVSMVTIYKLLLTLFYNISFYSFLYIKKRNIKKSKRVKNYKTYL